MTRGLPWLLLSLSLLFNVFFAVGFVQARSSAMSSERQAAQRAADMLELSADQRRVFDRLRERHRDDAGAFEEELMLKRRALLEELGREAPDIERVRTLVDEEADLHRQRRQLATERFSEFLTVLSPEQCRELGRHMPPPPHMIERFDANGDGRLDDAERAEADRHFQQRRAEREARRQEFMKRFDADGDGQLDETERAAMRRELGERPPWRRRDRDRPERPDRPEDPGPAGGPPPPPDG